MFANQKPWRLGALAVQALVTAFMQSLVSAGALTAQLSQRQARVEVLAPKPPTPVIIDSAEQVLVYELHVTNMGGGALRLVELQVSGNNPSRLLATYRDAALRDMVERAGLRQGGATRLDPGQRAVVFVWLPLSRSSSMPATLSHRVLFDILDSAYVSRDAGTQQAIDRIIVPVLRDSQLVIKPPLDSGEWLVGDGASNTSSHRRSVNAVDGSAQDAERFAIDFVRIGPNGDTYQGDEHRNESYWTFNQPVRSVADGEVVAVVDSIADHTPHAPIPRVTLANIAGNYVTVKIGAHRFATYAHLRRGSTRVRVGQHLKTGDVLGLVGNTGQATGPHLHFQITDAPSVLAAEGIPFVFERYRFLGNAADFEESKHPNQPRRNMLPREDEVIGFPSSR